MIMQTHRSQQGAVLFTALIFLIVTTVIALASIRSGVLEVADGLGGGHAVVYPGCR
jgi:Tfp pilus assembly protein PilX